MAWDRLLRAGLLAAVLMGAAGAVAPATVRADENAEARVYFERGTRELARAMSLRGAARTRALEGALEAFVASLRIVRSRNAVYNAGVTLQELGRNAEAFGYYTEYLSMPGVSEAERADTTQRRDAMRSSIAVVFVDSAPPGAEVRVDRRDLAPRGRTPTEIAVPAGEHTIFVSRDGYDDGQVRVTATTGQRVEARVQLEARPVQVRIVAAAGDLTLDGRTIQAGVVELPPGRHAVRLSVEGRAPVERVFEIVPGSEPLTIDLGAPAPALSGTATGAITVRSNVRASVLVGGAPVGDGAEVSAPVEAGDQIVRVQAPGYAPVERRVHVEPGGEIAMTAALEPSVEGQTTLGALPIVGAVTTGLVAGVATVFSIVAIAANDGYEQDNDACRQSPSCVAGSTELADLLAAREDVESANTRADVFWGITAGVGLATLVLYLIDVPVDQPPSTITIGAAPLPGGAAASASFALEAF